MVHKVAGEGSLRPELRVFCGSEVRTELQGHALSSSGAACKGERCRAVDLELAVDAITGQVDCVTRVVESPSAEWNASDGDTSL